MAQWAYKVVYIDYRGRISSEGLETLISNERRSTFARRYLNKVGSDGWELVGIQPLTSNSAYYIFQATRARRRLRGRVRRFQPERRHARQRRPHRRNGVMRHGGKGIKRMFQGKARLALDQSS